MAAIDFNQNPDALDEPYDVVIVGAGAAGLFLASKVSRERRVLVLESGHFAEDGDRQQLNEVVQEGKHMQAAVWGRKRAIGGTTIAWGGQSLPFAPLDFEEREWVHGSGWPIAYRDLEPHYKAANRAIGVDEADYRDDAFRLLSYVPPLFNQDSVDLHVSKWTPDPNFRRVFSKSINTSFDVVYNAQVTNLRFEGNAVEGIEVSNFEGHSSTAPTPTLVLACGGLETVRTLLLASDRSRIFTDVQRARLGRGFMDHPCIDAGVVESERPYRLQQAFATHMHRRRKYSIRLTASETLVRRLRLLNVSASLMFVQHDGVFDPYSEFRDFRQLLARPANFLITSGAFVRTAAALVRHRFVYKHGTAARLSLMCEQEPLDQSRIRLHRTATDRFGLPLLTVDWRISSKTWETVTTFSHVLQNEFDRLDLGHVHLRPEVQGSVDRSDLLTDVNHHMGGAAMGADPQTSVVAPDLRVRGVSNLFACSTAVYPTGSHSNPTLTLLALADALADRLL